MIIRRAITWAAALCASALILSLARTVVLP